MGAGFGALTGAAGIAEMAGVGGMGARALGMMDPFGAAMNAGMGGYGMAGRAGMGMAGRVGMGMMAGTGVGLGVAGVGMAAHQTATQFTGGFQQQQGLNQFLGNNFSFGNQGAASGRGFSANQSSRIGSAMRSFEAADPFTTMGDMNSMMSEFTEMGMAQGVRDSEEFVGKFKKMADTVRSMAMAMGTSMTEASQTFGQMRQAGFFTASDVMGNTQQMQVMKGMGMSAEQFGGMQRQGAGMFRAQHMSGRAGATAMANAAQGIMANTTGRAAENLMDMTGTTNIADASQQMAQRQVGATAGMLNQSGFGGALGAALGATDASGKFTGGLSGDMMGRLRSGDLSIRDLTSAGGAKTRGRAGGASFSANKRDINTKLMEQEDIIPQIMDIIKKEAGEDTNMQELLTQRMFQTDRETARSMLEGAEGWQGKRRESRRRLQSELSAQAMQAEISRNRSIGGITQQITGGISDMFSPVAQAGADMATGAENVGMDLRDQLLGIHRQGVTAGGLDATSMALATGSGLNVPTSSSGSVSDFAIGRFGEGQTLTGAVARTQGVGAAGAASQMAAGGGIGDLGGALGITAGRQDKLQKTAAKLGGNQHLQTLIRKAQSARQRGDKREVRRLRRDIDRIVTSELPRSGKKGVGGMDQSIKDTAFVLGEMGASSLVNEQFGDESGKGAVNTFQDLETAQNSLEAEAQELFGTSSFSVSRYLGETMTVKNVLTMGLAGGYAALGGSGPGMFDAGDAQFLVEGGAGSNVLAGLKGKEEKFDKIRQAASNAGTEEEKYEILLTGLKSLTGRTDITLEDAKAAYQFTEGTDLRDLKKVTDFASKAEKARLSPAMLESARQAIGSKQLQGLEVEQMAVQSQLRSDSAGGTFAKGGSVEALLEAAISGGNIGELSGSIGTSARGMSTVREKGIRTRTSQLHGYRRGGPHCGAGRGALGNSWSRYGGERPDSRD
jgi:hypothetical protein